MITLSHNYSNIEFIFKEFVIWILKFLIESQFSIAIVVPNIDM